MPHVGENLDPHANLADLLSGASDPRLKFRRSPLRFGGGRGRVVRSSTQIIRGHPLRGVPARLRQLVRQGAALVVVHGLSVLDKGRP